MNKIKIGNKLIGENEPVFIVAEAGFNHNGNIKLARKMIKEAAKAGADAIKFQIVSADRFVPPKIMKTKDQEKVLYSDETLYNILKNTEEPLEPPTKSF